MPKLPDELIAPLIEAYLAGNSTYVLARRFGIHRQTVARHLERAGVERREGNCRAETPAVGQPQGGSSRDSKPASSRQRGTLAGSRPYVTTR